MSAQLLFQKVFNIRIEGGRIDGTICSRKRLLCERRLRYGKRGAQDDKNNNGLVQSQHFRILDRIILTWGRASTTNIDVNYAGWFGRLLVADVRPGNLSQDLEIKLDTKLNISRGAGSTNRAKPSIS